MSAENPWENGTTANEAWHNLSAQELQPAEPGFVAGAVAQFKEEVHIPTKATMGASFVHSVANALRAGEDEWQKIEPPTTPTKPVDKKPLIPEPIKEGAKLLGILAASAIGTAFTNAAERNKQRKVKQSTNLVLYNGSEKDDDIIDVEAMDVEE